MQTILKELQQAHQYLGHGRPELAQALFAQLEQTLEGQGLKADALNGLGLCAEALRQPLQAEAFYRAALELRPQEPEFLNNLAICLQAQKKEAQALAVFQQLLALRPEPGLYYNLFLLLRQLGQDWDALVALSQAVVLAPAWELLQFQLLELARQLTADRQVLPRLQALLAQNPEHPVWHFLLGSYYEQQGNSELAIRYYRLAGESRPSLLEAWCSLLALLHRQGRDREALEVARKWHLAAGTPRSLIELITSLQHPLPASRDEIQALRQEILCLADDFSARQAQAGARRFLLQGRPYVLNFYHSYQAGEDRVLQESLARFFTSLSPALATPCQSTRRHSRPRLGLISHYLYRHSVTDLLQGAFKTLLASPDVQSWLFCLEPVFACHADDITEQLQAHADHFILLPDYHAQAAEKMRELELDVLIFSDIGMDSFSYFLALNRLARHQLSLPGHPITSGIPTIDYFVSAQALESPGSDAHYSEQLICLPGLPDYLQPVMPASASRQELGLPEGHLYFCPMSLFKLHPDFDQVLAAMLAQDPLARILFLQNQTGLHFLFQERLQQAEVDLERIVFLPRSSQEVFFQRLLAADVILDTFPFGGGNTSYQALGLGCPMVCLDVPWQKGRWTQAMYHLMGIEGLVASDIEDYARLAVRVARDKAWQAELREQIRERSRVLFDNPTWSQALLDFCLQLTASEGPDAGN